MEKTIYDRVARCRWKAQTIMRTAKFHTVDELVLLYKAKILSIIEYRTAAIYHTAQHLLEMVNDIQDTFIWGLNLTTKQALLHYDLAPLAARRDIAMLGIIHRSAIGQ